MKGAGRTREEGAGNLSAWNLRGLVNEMDRTMGKRIYVGNLPWAVRDTELEQIFNQFGMVASAQVLLDRETGRSRGFGFVEMSNDGEAEVAIEQLNGSEINGRRLTVNEAQARTPRGGGGSNGYR